MGSNFSIFEIKSYFRWRGCEVAAIELVDLIIQVSSSQRGLKYPEVSASVVETKHPPRKKLVEKTWFLAIMEGIRCVTYSDDGTVLEMFIRLATMEN